MTPKQQRFVEEYLVDLNATQATGRSGYDFPEEAAGFYVYLLIDPRDDSIFYVGKGSGNRMSWHAALVSRGRHDNGTKCAKILDIQACGMNVKEQVFAAGLTEADAFEVEGALIRGLREYGLTNIAGGMVTSERAARDYARVMLGRLKTYGEWMENLSQNRREQVESVFGSPHDFYRWYKQALCRVAEQEGSHG